MKWRLENMCEMRSVSVSVSSVHMSRLMLSMYCLTPHRAPAPVCSSAKKYITHHVTCLIQRVKENIYLNKIL